MGTRDPERGDGLGTKALPVRTWAKAESLRLQEDQSVVVTAINRGRMTVWVDSVGLCSGHDSSSQTMVVDRTDQGLGSGPTLPFRLHAGQSAHWAIPLRDAGSLCMAEDVSDFGCIHGHVTLSNGMTVTSEEGARIGQVREALMRMLHDEVRAAEIPDATSLGYSLTAVSGAVSTPGSPSSAK